MNNDKLTAKDRITFIHLMLNAPKTNEQEKRIALCLSGMGFAENKLNEKIDKVILKDSFDNIRRKHRPDVTANLFALFGSPSGLKFLTHDFDPNSNMSMMDVIEEANKIINSNDYRFKIPGSLYSLLNGFINGFQWMDYRRGKHNFYLKSEQMINWINNSPAFHPIVSDVFGDEINLFRNTIRVSKPNLATIFNSLLSNDSRFINFSVQTDNLDKADFYTNVFWMIFMILSRTLIDIEQRDKNANIKIIFDRSSWQEYRLCSIKIIHIGSEANPFEEVKNKLMTSGGALYNLMSSCSGYCDWSIEANFEGEFKRWRILNFRNLPEEEMMSLNEIEGFTHIFTFYKK